MSRWTLETTPEFDRAARRLDKPVLLQIKTYFDEVLELDDPRSRGRGLSANLASYWGSPDASVGVLASR